MAYLTRKFGNYLRLSVCNKAVVGRSFGDENEMGGGGGGGIGGGEAGALGGRVGGRC